MPTTAGETLAGQTTAGTWVGREVVLKRHPVDFRGPGDDGKGYVAGTMHLWVPEVVSDTGDWVQLGCDHTLMRVHRTDLVLTGEAVEYFTRLIRRDAGNPDHYLRRALGLISCGRAALAVADCDQAVQLAPTDARAWLIRGRAWCWGGDRVRGLGDLTEAVRLDPTAAWTWGTESALLVGE